MRLLLDQGLPLSTATTLSESGAQVVHVAQIGLSQASDADILAYAREHAYICVTLDADFHALLAVQGVSAPSVIRIRREGLRGPMLAQLLRAIWPQIDAQIAAGAMVTVTERTLRIHRLPILGDR